MRKLTNLNAETGKRVNSSQSPKPAEKTATTGTKPSKAPRPK
jgi:hypothetical protein